MMFSLKKIRLGKALPELLFRFVGVGALSSLVYVLSVMLYVDFLSIGAVWSSALAYATATPLSFVGHRRVTFRSKGNLKIELGRFIVLHVTNIIISVGGMVWAVSWAGYSYWLGSFLAVILVPLSTFVIMKSWVFSGRNPR